MNKVTDTQIYEFIEGQKDSDKCEFYSNLFMNRSKELKIHSSRFFPYSPTINLLIVLLGVCAIPTIGLLINYILGG